VKSAIEKNLYIAFAIVCAIAAVMVYSLVQNARQAVRTSDWVRHTHATIFEVESVLSSLHAGEAAYRQFLLTKSSPPQEAYRKAFTEMGEHLQVAKALASESPSHLEKLKRIETLLAERLSLAREVVQARERGALDDSVSLLKKQEQATSLTEIEKLIKELKVSEDQLLQERDRDWKASATRTKWTTLGLAIFEVLLLGAVFGLVKQDLRLRREKAMALSAANEVLEQKVRERTADLVKTNDTLETENLERRWAQATLEQILRRNELIIESITQPIFVISRRGNILGGNPAAAEATRLTEKGFTGKPLRQFLKDPKGRNELPWGEDPIEAALARNEMVRGHSEFTASDGTTQAAQFTAFPMKAEKKVVGAVVTIDFDVSPAGLG
jgi:PAS domain S-box-containing protein